MLQRSKRDSRSQPPSFRTALTGSCRIRYYSSTGFGPALIAQADLAELIVVGTVNTPGQCYRVLDSVRLKRIEMWGISAVTATPSANFVSINDLGANTSLGGPERTLQDMSLSNAVPSHLVWTPAPNSIQGTWVAASNTQTTPILAMQSTSPCIVDVTIDYVVGDGTVGPTIGGPITTPAVGQIYYRKFGYSSSSSNLIPQGVSYAA